MRTLPIYLLAVLAVSEPAAAQGIVLPSGCAAACPAQALSIDSVRAWANLERGQAGTFVNYTFRNQTDGVLDGAFFFPLPNDAELVWTTVYVNGRAETHGEWDGPGEAQRVMAGLVGGRPPAGVGDDAWRAMVHVRIPAIPPHGVKRLQVHYTQPLRAEGERITYRYPLSAAAAASPIGHLQLGMEVTTEAGFRDVLSPSHAVDVQWGTESARCPPRMRCGYRSVTSHRVKVVRLTGDPDRTRDFELLYTPLPVQSRQVEASVP
jgi:hypothetical protein